MYISDFIPKTNGKKAQFFTVGDDSQTVWRLAMLEGTSHAPVSEKPCG